MRFPTRRQFENWLTSQAPEQVVGTTDKGDSCPLATYLRANGAPEAQVDTDEWYVEGPYTPSRKLPLWAEDFVHDVDFWFQDRREIAWMSRTGIGMNASTALKLLRE